MDSLDIMGNYFVPVSRVVKLATHIGPRNVFGLPHTMFQTNILSPHFKIRRPQPKPPVVSSLERSGLDPHFCTASVSGREPSHSTRVLVCRSLHLSLRPAGH